MVGGKMGRAMPFWNFQSTGFTVPACTRTRTSPAFGLGTGSPLTSCATSHKSRVTSHESQVTSHKSHVTGHRYYGSLDRSPSTRSSSEQAM